MDVPSIIAGLVIGVLLGGAGAALLLMRSRAAVARAALEQRLRTEGLEEDVQEARDDVVSLRQTLQSQDSCLTEAREEVVRLTEQLSQKTRQFEEQQALLAQSKRELGDAFKALGAEALKANNQQFIELAKSTFEQLMTEAKGDVEKRQQAIDTLVEPIRELLEKQSTAIGDIEKKREVAYKGLEEQISQIVRSHEKLGTETGRLVTALRRPHQRGQWGQMQLRNTVELSGMTAHCDFEEEVTVYAGEKRQRPDMVVNLPGEGVIVVDSKVALSAYLDAIECEDEQLKSELLLNHARQVEEHYKSLAAKQYWEAFERTPKLVVMFMPLESALVAALEQKPDLHHDAMQNHVLIATPTLLVALLRAIAYGWQQEDVAANARQIARVGSALYDRIATFVDHYEKVGAALRSATRSYNKSVGSLESRLLTGARKLKELHATSHAELKPPAQIDVDVRAIASDELKNDVAGKAQPGGQMSLHGE